MSNISVVLIFRFLDFQVFLHIQIFNKIKFISHYLQKYMKNKPVAFG